MLNQRQAERESVHAVDLVRLPELQSFFIGNRIFEEMLTLTMNNFRLRNTQVKPMQEIPTENVPVFRSSSHHGKPTQSGPRDDGFIKQDTLSLDRHIGIAS